VLGILAAFFVARILYKKYGYDPALLYDLAFYAILCAIIGGRLYYVLYAWEYYQYDLLEIFKIWHVGMALHGDIIGGIIGLLIYTKKHKINVLHTLDIVAPGIALGTAIGRWGNYFNQELFGKPTDAWWGIPIETINRPTEYMASEYFHPTFLYSSFLNFLLFLDLILLHYIIIKYSITRLAKGSIFIIYIIEYSIIRFIMEFYRIDFSPEVFGIRWAQLLSFLLILGGIVGVVALNVWKGKHESRKVEKV